MRSINQPRELATLQLLYYMPDHPSLLQEFIWQTLDHPPAYPRINRFLCFWQDEIHAVIHSVNVSCAGMIKPFQLRAVKFSIKC